MIGIDVGARKCHIYDAVSGTELVLTTAETIAYLETQAPTRVVLELTGAYGRVIAEHAHCHGHEVWLAHDTDASALRTLLRTTRKSDKLDAKMLAKLAELPESLAAPVPYLTPYTEIRPLLAARKLAHTWRYLTELRAAIRTRNRLPDAEPIPLEEPITMLIEQYKQRTIEAVPPKTLELLTTIPGVSPGLAALIYVTLGDITRFRNRDAIVSYAGVAPRHAPRSGNATGRPRRHRFAVLLSSHLHTYALRVAKNPDQYDRLGETYTRVKQRADGRRALHATKRHLIRLAAGVLRSGKPYEYARARPDEDTA